MLKKLLFLTLAVLFALPTFAQHKRRVLVEEFTNASCGPCAFQNPQFNQVLADRADIITPIKYQTVWPGVDPMNAHNQSDVANRVTYYGVQGVPNGFINGIGIVNDCNAYDNAPYCLAVEELDDAHTQETPVSIDVTYTTNAKLDSIFITVKVTADAAVTGDLALRVAVIEDEIIFKNAPGTNGEKEFFQVMKKMLPTPDGTATGDFAAGETKTYNFAWKMANIYEFNHVGVNAWLQDDASKEVWQSFRALPNVEVASPKIDIQSSLFNCTPGVSPTFDLSNAGKKELTAATLRYRLGTAAFANYNWTGSLSPGQKETITLTGITFTTSGNTKVDVELVNFNGQAYPSLVKRSATMQVKNFLSAGSALPYGSDFQGTFPPTGWSVTNVGANGWKTSSVGAGGSTKSTTNNFFNYSTGVTYLYSSNVDLSKTNGSTALTFDHAYAYYDAADGTYWDSLRVEMSTDCGATWTTIFHDGYEGLATGAPTGSAYTPADDSEWRNNSIDISDFVGSNSVLFRFAGETGFGNNLFIDNVNVTFSSGVKPLELSAFSLTPNPAKEATEMRFTLDEAQDVQVSVYKMDGSVVKTLQLGAIASGDHAVRIETADLSAGSYRVAIQGDKGVAHKQLVVVR